MQIEMIFEEEGISLEALIEKYLLEIFEKEE